MGPLDIIVYLVDYFYTCTHAIIYVNIMLQDLIDKTHFGIDKHYFLQQLNELPTSDIKTSFTACYVVSSPIIYTAAICS